MAVNNIVKVSAVRQLINLFEQRITASPIEKETCQSPSSAICTVKNETSPSPCNTNGPVIEDNKMDTQGKVVVENRGNGALCFKRVTNDAITSSDDCGSKKTATTKTTSSTDAKLVSDKSANNKAINTVPISNIPVHISPASADSADTNSTGNKATIVEHANVKSADYDEKTRDASVSNTAIVPASSCTSLVVKLKCKSISDKIFAFNCGNGRIRFVNIGIKNNRLWVPRRVYMLMRQKLDAYRKVKREWMERLWEETRQFIDIRIKFSIPAIKRMLSNQETDEEMTDSSLEDERKTEENTNGKEINNQTEVNKIDGRENDQTNKQTNGKNNQRNNQRNKKKDRRHAYVYQSMEKISKGCRVLWVS